MKISVNPYKGNALRLAWEKGYAGENLENPTSEELRAHDMGKKSHARDTAPIPRGYYCYKFKGNPADSKDGSFPIRSCPYYSYEEREFEGTKEKVAVCGFLKAKQPNNKDDFFATIMDQVKECGENYDD